MATVMKYGPQWTHRVVMEGSGRDPLGLSRVSDELTDYLLPCIITTTDRARYYTFYSWAIADIQEQFEKSQQRVPFKEEFQRREAAFALASGLGKSKFPIVGTRKVNAILAEASPDDRINTNFKVLPSNDTGGFGQYYQGCLSKLGLVTFDQDRQCWITSELGERAAKAFYTATHSAPYLAGDWKKKVWVPQDVLRASTKLFSLDAIRGRTATVERNLLIELFFCLGESAAVAQANRQVTLGQFLHVLVAYEKANLPVKKWDVDRAVLFWPHYYGRLYTETASIFPYTTMLPFSKTHGFWRQFCVHQFFAYAMEEFLAAVLDALSPHPEGLAKDALLEALFDGFIEDLNHVLQIDCRNPASLLLAMGIKDVPNERVSRSITQRFGAMNSLNEWEICAKTKGVPKTRLGRSMLLLVMLYGKWRGEADDEAFRLVSEGVNEVWVGTSFEWIDSWVKERMDWRTVWERLIDWVIIRHDEVKFQKRRLDASWLELADARYLQQQDIEPNFRSSRHGNAAMILYDLGLLNYEDHVDEWKLTEEGKKVLHKVTLVRS